MKKVYIALGSNLGNRICNLRLAVEKLKKMLKNYEISIILETKALVMDNVSQLSHLNMVMSGETDLTPHQLLVVLKLIERELGRETSSQKWSPRVIDLDILLYGDEIVNSDELTIPHPELKNRLFLQHLLAVSGVDGFKLQNNAFIKSLALSPAIMGIVNVTDDSFSDGGKFSNPERAIDQALKLIVDGASLVDIGAQATSPGAVMKTTKDEIITLQPILDALQNRQFEISIDTFRDEVVAWVLNNSKIDWINDVSGSLRSDTLELIRDHDKKLCVMHSLSVPTDKNIVLPHSCDPIEEIILWGQKKIDQLLRLRYKLENIILDPGIGFGKTFRQNITIIKRVRELREKLGVQILLGHSRKSFMSVFSSSLAHDRDIETIAISNIVAEGVDYLRLHDVSNHMKALVAQQLIIN